MQDLKEENQTIDAENTAKVFKFYLQFKNPYLRFAIPFKRVSARSLYLKYQKEFDNLTAIFSKYNLDLTKYVRFFIEVLDKQEKDIKQDLISNSSISKYVDWLKLLDKQDKIYKYFIKSAKNIANDSNALGYYSTKDFIRYLIANKKLAEYYVTGKISLYYFAAIPNFKKIIPKLDPFAKAEFQKIYDRFEMYNAEVTSAYMRITNQKVNPIKFTDDLIYKTRQSNNV